jgi:hypothetical protein
VVELTGDALWSAHHDDIVRPAGGVLQREAASQGGQTATAALHIDVVVGDRALQQSGGALRPRFLGPDEPLREARTARHRPLTDKRTTDCSGGSLGPCGGPRVKINYVLFLLAPRRRRLVTKARRGLWILYFVLTS